MSHRRLRHLPKLLAAVGLAGCLVHCGHDAPEEPGWSGSRADRLRARLERETGGRWVVTGDPKADDVRFVAPLDDYPVKDSTPEKTVRAFLRAYGAELGHPVGEPELPVERVEPNGSFSVVRFSLVDPKTKLPYLDRKPVASLKPDGSLLSLAPTVPPTEVTVAPPRISVADARAKARAHLAATCALDPAEIPDEAQAETGIVVDGVDRPRAVHALSFTLEDERCGSTEVRVDAATGEVVATVARDLHMWAPKNRGARYYYTHNVSVPPEDDEKTLSVRASGGAYELVSIDGPVEVRTVLESANGARTPVRASTPSSFDSDATSVGAGAAVDVHYHLFTAYDWFNRRYGWTWPQAFNEGAIEGVAHAPGVTAFDQAGKRFSFSDGGGVQKVPVGPCPRPCERLPYAAASFVVGHEMAHAVTVSSHRVTSSDETGALSESIADVLGATFAHTMEGGTPWLAPEAKIARDVAPSQRRMDRPQINRYYAIPSCGIATEANDRCNIHLVAGVGTQAWYLMTMGGVHADTRVSIDPGRALGLDDAAWLWFTSIFLSTETSKFREYALAQVTITNHMWGYGSPKAEAVVCAWNAVEVLDDVIAGLLLGRPCAKVPKSPQELVGCGRVRDGLVCSPEDARLAYVCKNGQIYGAQICEAANTVCAPNLDSTARTKADGSLDCEVTVRGSSR